MDLQIRIFLRRRLRSRRPRHWFCRLCCLRLRRCRPRQHQLLLQRLRDQHWHRVAGGGLLVHLGDIVQVWSNDRYRSPVHRVATNSEAERFSAPFFFNPSYETNYRPMEATVDADHPPQYTSINWGQFRRLRADGDYGDYGDEVQIRHYRIAGE